MNYMYDSLCLHYLRVCALSNLSSIKNKLEDRTHFARYVRVNQLWPQARAHQREEPSKVQSHWNLQNAWSPTSAVGATVPQPDSCLHMLVMQTWWCTDRVHCWHVAFLPVFSH